MGLACLVKFLESFDSEFFRIMQSSTEGKAACIKFLFHRTIILVLLSSIFWQAAYSYPIDPVMRWSRIRKGSKVSLIGIPLKDYHEPFQSVWFKDRIHINPKSTKRYTTMKQDTQLLIHNFQIQDVGCYHFFYSNNVTKKEVIFHLEMFPEEEPNWYSKNSTTVGTVIGMVFLVLMVVVLVYYCCSKDADTALTVFQMKQPMALPDSHPINTSFRYTGVKFTTQITVPNKNGPRKKSCDVRRDSLMSLSLQSRQQRSNITKKKSRKKKTSVVKLLRSQPSALL